MSTGVAAAKISQLAAEVSEIMTSVHGAGKAIASEENKGNK